MLRTVRLGKCADMTFARGPTFLRVETEGDIGRASTAFIQAQLNLRSEPSPDLADSGIFTLRVTGRGLYLDV